MSKKHRRRSSEEIAELVAEYEASGETRGDFARAQGIAGATLDAYRRRVAGEERAQQLLPVEWVMEVAERAGAVRVTLRNERAIAMDWRFDEVALAWLVAVLERA